MHASFARPSSWVAAIACGASIVWIHGCHDAAPASGAAEQRIESPPPDETAGAVPAPSRHLVDAGTGDLYAVYDEDDAGGPARGLFRVIEKSAAHRAADPNSRVLLEFPIGSYVRALFRHGAWLLVDWVEGPPGRARPASTRGWILSDEAHPTLEPAQQDDAGKPRLNER